MLLTDSHLQGQFTVLGQGLLVGGQQLRQGGPVEDFYQDPQISQSQQWLKKRKNILLLMFQKRHYLLRYRGASESFIQDYSVGLGKTFDTFDTQLHMPPAPWGGGWGGAGGMALLPFERGRLPTFL